MAKLQEVESEASAQAPIIRIREASVEDIDTIHDLGETVSEFSVNDETITFWPQDILAHAIASNDAIVLIAELNQEIVGFIIANLNISLRKAIIENVYVRPENRDVGIGGKLLNELLISLGSTDIEYICTLIPLDTDNASRLYLEAGFSKGESFLWLDMSLSDTFNK